MKRAQLLGIGVAGSAGVLAFVTMQGIIDKPPVETTIEVQVKSTEVLVARADIGLGQVANESLFRWQSWPQEAATSGFITRASNANAMTQMSGAIARAPIMAGEPITSQKLIKAGQGGVLAAILPPGMRAISTKIKEETAVGRLILPNDRVDVILIRRIRGRGGSEEHVSDTLFHNVRVLALGQQIESKEGKKAAESNANTATLELTPQQSELLALANSMGEISLSLRSITDLQAAGDEPTAGDALNKPKNGNAIRVLRYGVRSRAYGVN
ncbi:MAG TPA: Flp pilus assembly protein CpaB [Hyphomicrobiaceae bacterium]|nr:Flp pilus assembly protein CpaB [Hyphomicrobiaceae bacterium]